MVGKGAKGMLVSTGSRLPRGAGAMSAVRPSWGLLSAAGPDRRAEEAPWGPSLALPGLLSARAIAGSGGSPSPRRLDTSVDCSPQQADSATEPESHAGRQEAHSPPSSQDTLEIKLQSILPGGLSCG